MINEAAKTYPNFKAVATTLRTVKTATVNDWAAICWADGEIFKSGDTTMASKKEVEAIMGGAGARVQR